MSSLAANPTEAMSFKKISEVMQVKKLSEFAVMPTRGSEYAAGNMNGSKLLDSVAVLETLKTT